MSFTLSAFPVESEVAGHIVPSIPRPTSILMKIACSSMYFRRHTVSSLLSIDSVTPKCALSEDQQPLEPTTEHSDRFFRSPTKVALAFPPMARGEPLHTEKENADSLARIISECNSLYLEQADAFMNATLPPKPNHWVQKSGWTRYNTDGSTMSVEDFGISSHGGGCITYSMVLMVRCTVGIQNSLRKTLDKRISLGPPGIPRVVVGHNVTYDRARIQEEYLEEPTSIAYICTMALNIALFRYNARETMVWIKLMEGKTNYALEPVPQGYWDCSSNSEKRLVTASTCNGLKHLVKLHLGETMDKSTRDLFSGHHLLSIRSPTTFQEAMRYCAEDVALTHGLYKKLFSMFRQEFPDTASFAMMLRMAPPGQYAIFPYSVSFWVSAKVLMKWSNKKAATPYLLQLRWDGHEMFTPSMDGCIIFVTIPKTLFLASRRLLLVNLILRTQVHYGQTSDDFEPLFLADSSRIYFRVPHSDGKNARCGSPLHQGFYYAINNGRLSSGSASGQRYLELFARTLYWERIKSLYE
ncbi:hypothetical protein BSLG_008197 [Batrachochytrium salamandrivorans]|nr:hypothetical protein BSLG_008197 [Batrachochytrium salamandrivorans]